RALLMHPWIEWFAAVRSLRAIRNSVSKNEEEISTLRATVEQRWHEIVGDVERKTGQLEDQIDRAHAGISELEDRIDRVHAGISERIGHYEAERAHLANTTSRLTV